VYLIFKYYLSKLSLQGLEGPELIVVTVQGLSSRHCARD